MRLIVRTCVLALIACVGPAAASAQWDVTPKAATPAVPYWLQLGDERGLEFIPLLWLSDLDGVRDEADSSGCCVLGFAGRNRLAGATLWWALGFGLESGAGTPSAIEVAAEIDGGVVSFRKLHGRSGFNALYPLYSRPGAEGGPLSRLSVGISAVWLDDGRYLESVPFFKCSPAAPALPCETQELPYAWSRGDDYAVVAEAVGGASTWTRPRLQGSLALGLKVAGGDHGYARLEAEARVEESFGPARLDARLAGGWASGGAPQQRRYLLEGADPIHRWLNPYIDARGALLSELPYHVPGGPGLRGYEATRPLVRRYLALSAHASRQAETAGGFWARLGPYAAAAWTPGLPDRLGPEQLNENGDLLFDWQELPPEEGGALGQFRARTLALSEFWADAGLAVTGGHRRVSVTFALPLWANKPAFASAPIGGGEKRAFAVRWSLTIEFNATPAFRDAE